MISTAIKNYFKERGDNYQISTYDNGNNMNCSTMLFITGTPYAFEEMPTGCIEVIDSNDDTHTYSVHRRDDNSFDYLYTLPGFKFADVIAVMDILGSFGASAHITVTTQR
ncbi:hypothetical protein ACP3S7_30380 [Phytobacter ursingii]